MKRSIDVRSTFYEKSSNCALSYINKFGIHFFELQWMISACFLALSSNMEIKDLPYYFRIAYCLLRLTEKNKKLKNLWKKQANFENTGL